MNAFRVAIVAIVSSAVLFLLSISTSFMVETVQPNGLPEIYQPYGWISAFSSLAAIWFLIFGMTLSFVAPWRRGLGEARRPILGSGLVSGGVFAAFFGAFWSLVNLQDEGPRCLDGCAPSLLQYYQTVYLSSGILVVLGLAAIFFGGRLLRRRVTTGASISAVGLPSGA